MINSKDALNVAYIAYMRDKKGDNIVYLNEKNDRCCVIIEDNVIKIGSAGSNDLKDWMQNTLILGQNFGRLGRVPRGFIKNIDGLVDKIAFHIQSHKDKLIQGSGHSRGVPLIAFILYRLWERGFNIGSFVGFGSPKFLKTKGIKQFNAVIPNIKLYKNGADQVTRHPNFGYKHPVTLTKIGPNRRFLSIVFNKDHLISNYIKNI